MKTTKEQIKKAMKEVALRHHEKKQSEPSRIGQKIINLLKIKEQEIEKQLRHYSSFQDQKTLERLKDSLARSIDDVRRAIH